MTKLHTLLKKLGACSEAVEFAKGKELTEAWNTCERPDWMLWLCAKMIGKTGWPTHQQIILATCDCAETTLLIFEKKYPKDSRPRTAIETARKRVNGEATIEEVRAAAYAAYAAAYAAYAAAYAPAAYGHAAADAAGYAAAYAAADAAAYAADAAAHAASAAYAAYAADAAAHAASAAYAATAPADVTYRITLADKRKELANLIRKQLIIPKENKNGTRTQSKL